LTGNPAQIKHKHPNVHPGWKIDVLTANRESSFFLVGILTIQILLRRPKGPALSQPSAPVVATPTTMHPDRVQTRKIYFNHAIVGRRPSMFFMLRQPIFAAPIAITRRSKRWQLMGRKPTNRTDVPERVKSIFESKRLTLHRVSNQSARIKEGLPSCYIPHNFYHALRAETFCPSLSQVCALSKITGYRLLDWLKVFGFDSERIPQLQAQLPSKRTFLLDTSFDFRDPWRALLLESTSPDLNHGLVPLGQKVFFLRQRNPSAEQRTQQFLYAKIGSEDALAFPDLLPGSIVRVNPTLRPDESGQKSSRDPNHIFLIEHNCGLWCCRLRFPSKGHIVARSDQVPRASIHAYISGRARILGAVDTEFRNMDTPFAGDIPHWLPGENLWDTNGGTTLGDLLRRARLRSGMSFRTASRMSRTIADIFQNQHYFAAAGSLSDYEALITPPRSIEKIITLSILYGLPFAFFVRHSGVPFEELGREPIPNLIPGKWDQDISAESYTTTASENRLDLLPLILGRDTAKPFVPSDCFWVADISDVHDPYLSTALVVIMNRRRKALPSIASRSWQPYYVLARRDGTYQCAQCYEANGKVILRHRSEEIALNRKEVDVIGQVRMIVRKLT
jgi:hypothetical protein